MNIAVQFQKIYLDDDKFIFKPVGIIRGIYDEEDNTFVSDFGVLYQNISEIDIDPEFYFDNPTTIEELKNSFGPEVLEESLLTEYFNLCVEYCYIGYHDYEKGYSEVKKIPFEDIEKYSSNSVIQTSIDSDSKFIFELSELNKLRNLDNIEEVQSTIDSLIQISKNIKAESVEKEEKSKLVLKKEESKQFNLKKLREVILKDIVSQDEAVKRITARLAMNFQATNSKIKSHILIAGPTGTGKTEIIKIICKYLNIPYYKVVATDFTQEGYVGRSVSEMIEGLINSCDGDIEKAQNGILVIDEIDKKADSSGRGTVATKAVLDSLLKITGRDIIQVDIDEEGRKKTIDFDTSNLTVIMMGAFAGIEKKEVHKTIGFIKNEEKSIQNKEIESKDFIKYGMTPELMGRIKCIVQTCPFQMEDYVKIIYKSHISQINLLKEFFEKDKGIKFSFTRGYALEISKQAKEINEGARGLDKVISKSIEEATEKVLNNEHIKVLKLTKETALDNKKYYVE